MENLTRAWLVGAQCSGRLEGTSNMACSDSVVDIRVICCDGSQAEVAMQSLWGRVRTFSEGLSPGQFEKLNVWCRIMRMEQQGVDYIHKDFCICTMSSEGPNALYRRVSKEVTEEIRWP